MKQLLVGVGQEIITPAMGTMLMGYSPMRPALGVHDDLHVTAFAFETDGVQALLFSADLCNIKEPDGEVRRLIAQGVGVPEGNIIVSCTHTHSGPSTYKEDGFLYEMFIPKAIRAAAAALANRKPALMGIGQTYSNVAVNRREAYLSGCAELETLLVSQMIPEETAPPETVPEETPAETEE